MAAEMVKLATDGNLKEINWAKNIEICELVTRDPGKSKDVVKAIKKHLASRNSNTQLYSVMLLETLMNNCGENIHKLVIDTAVLPILLKIVKKKTDLPVRERIFLLLDATQTTLGGANGKFPEYYKAYYDLVSSGVQFAQSRSISVTEVQIRKPEANGVANRESLATKLKDGQKHPPRQPITDSSLIQKATGVMEVLRDVLNSIDPKQPQGAASEFVLDLVEQCTFQKQRVMHLVMTSFDDRLVAQTLDLNEKLHEVLMQHDKLMSARPTVASCLKVKDDEEDAESLYQRIRKGKACVEDDDESATPIKPLWAIPKDKLHRPLIRPVSTDPSNQEGKPPSLPAVSIPPPPAKHAEREQFFKERNNGGGVAGLPGQLQDLTLHSQDGSSSCSGSTDYGD